MTAVCAPLWFSPRATPHALVCWTLPPGWVRGSFPTSPCRPQLQPPVFASSCVLLLYLSDVPLSHVAPCRHVVSLTAHNPTGPWLPRHGRRRRLCVCVCLCLGGMYCCVMYLPLYPPTPPPFSSSSTRLLFFSLVLSALGLAPAFPAPVPGGMFFDMFDGVTGRPAASVPGGGVDGEAGLGRERVPVSAAIPDSGHPITRRMRSTSVSSADFGLELTAAAATVPTHKLGDDLGLRCAHPPCGIGPLFVVFCCHADHHLLLLLFLL